MEQLFSNSGTYSLKIAVSLSPLCADVAMEKTFRLYHSLSAEKNHHSHIIMDLGYKYLHVLLHCVMYHFVDKLLYFFCYFPFWHLTDFGGQTDMDNKVFYVVRVFS